MNSFHLNSFWKKKYRRYTKLPPSLSQKINFHKHYYLAEILFIEPFRWEKHLALCSMEVYDLGHMILCESGLDWTRPQFLFFLLSKSILFDELWDQFNPNPNYFIITSHFKLAIPKVHNMSHPFSHFSGKEFAFKN